MSQMAHSFNYSVYAGLRTRPKRVSNMNLSKSRLAAALLSFGFTLTACSSGANPTLPSTAELRQQPPSGTQARRRAFAIPAGALSPGENGGRKILSLSASTDDSGCGELYYGTGGSNNPPSPNPGDIDLGINTCDSQLGDSYTPSSNVGPGADGYCVAQENFLVDLVDAFMERYFPDVASGAATIEDTFVSTEKLAQSFDEHGAELGITNEEAFAKTANSMLIGAITDQPGLQIAQVGEQIYIYSSKTEAIGVYNHLGQTITMFKAPSSTYFFKQIVQGGGAQITSMGLRGFFSLIGGRVPGRELC